MAERYYYLAQWDEPKNARDADADAADFGPPQGTIGLVDLRPVSGSTFGFFATDRRLSASDWLGVKEPVFHAFGNGTDLREYRMSVEDKKRWRDLLGLTTDQMPDAEIKTLADALVWTFERTGDPEGAQRFKPPSATHDGYIELHFGGHSLLSRRQFVDLPETARENILDRVRLDMGRVYEAGQALGPTPRDLHRRMATINQRKYSVADYRQLYPQMLRGRVETPMKPHTTIVDDFTDSDGTDLSSHIATGSGGTTGWSWTEVTGDYFGISSNRAIYNVRVNAQISARAESDLSSDDHYAQADVEIDSGGYIQGIATRFGASRDDYYASAHHNNGNIYIDRIDGAVRTELGKWEDGASLSSTLYGEADGSSITVQYDGYEHTVTDTTFSGQTRCGISYTTANDGSTFGQINWDNFEAADLSVGDTYTVTPTGMAQTQAADAAGAVQQHSLTPGGAAQIQALDTTGMSQAHTLTPGEIVLAQSMDYVGVIQAYSLTPGEAAQTQGMDSAATAQAHTLTPGEIALSQSMDSATAVLTAIVAQPQGSAQVQAMDAAALDVQLHVCSPIGATLEQAMDAASLVQVYVLTPAGMDQTQAMDAAVYAVHEALDIISASLSAVVVEQYGLAVARPNYLLAVDLDTYFLEITTL